MNVDVHTEMGVEVQVKTLSYFARRAATAAATSTATATSTSISTDEGMLRDASDVPRFSGVYKAPEVGGDEP